MTSAKPGHQITRRLGQGPFSGCCGGNRFSVLMRNELGPLKPNCEQPRNPLNVKALSDADWRKLCQAHVAKIPAGYTYLAQLMGHDMGHSVDLLQRRVTIPKDKVCVDLAGEPLQVVRYNLIEHPLTLETIYGPSPRVLSHLYDENWLFRLRPKDRIARYFWPVEEGGRPVRALYDERNRDTLMIQHLAVFWMHFHNINAAKLIAAGEEPQVAYYIARDHAISVWHAIIINDILPRFVRGDILNHTENPIPEWQMDEVSLLHGLFRSFHAMPLEAYPIGGTAGSNKAINTLMKVDFDPTHAEIQHWSIDWTLFFSSDHDLGGPRAGISASVEPKLQFGGESLLILDEETAKTAWPNRLTSKVVDLAVQKLPDDWPKKITPKQMADDFAYRWPDAPLNSSADTLSRSQLSYTLMIEAQLHGENGGFGPLGSAFLLHSVRAAIGKLSRPELPRLTNTKLPAFESMAKLIKFVVEENEL